MMQLVSNVGWDRIMISALAIVVVYLLVRYSVALRKGEALSIALSNLGLAAVLVVVLARLAVPTFVTHSGMGVTGSLVMVLAGLVTCGLCELNKPRLRSIAVPIEPSEDQED